VRNIEEAGGQAVVQFHIRLIRRGLDDGQGTFWEPRHFTDETLDEIRSKLAQ